MKSIKAAGINDLPVIHHLAHAIWPHAYSNILSPAQLNYMLEKFYSPDSLKNQLLDWHHNFLLVLDNDIPVGFASFSPKEEDQSIFRLHKIYVLPQQQGSGTGKLLLETVITKAKEMGATLLELNVNRHNKARYFYEKQGFVIAGKIDIEIGSGFFMNDYIMELNLG